MCGYIFRFYSESAVRGIKKRKSKLKSECSVNSDISASASVEERPENATDVQDSVEKVSRCFLEGRVDLTVILYMIIKVF